MSPGLWLVWDIWPSVLSFLSAVESQNQVPKKNFLVFEQYYLVAILLVVSHPVSARSTGRHLIMLFPNALQMSWSGKIILLITELYISQSSWRPRSLQPTIKWYSRHSKTFVSPDNNVMHVGLHWQLNMSCTWNIILSSASSCVQLSWGNTEAHPADTIHACSDTPRYKDLEPQ